MHHRALGVLFLWLVTVWREIPAHPVQTLGWIETPRDPLLVLEHTTAIFTWNHTGTPSPDITWFYLGTPNYPKRDIIMLHTLNYSTPYGNKRSRLHHIDTPGSASITLDKVTSDDSGQYEVKVSHDVSEEGAQWAKYLVDVANLHVLSASKMTYNITINGTTFSSSSPITDHLSPSDHLNLTVSPGHRLNVTLMMVGPVKPSVSIYKQIGKSVEDEPPCEDYYCNRYIGFCSDIVSDSSMTGYIYIEIDYHIQNMSVIKHQISLDITKDVKSQASYTKHTSDKVISVALVPRYTSAVPQTVESLDSDYNLGALTSKDESLDSKSDLEKVTKSWNNFDNSINQFVKENQEKIKSSPGINMSSDQHIYSDKNVLFEQDQEGFLLPQVGRAMAVSGSGADAVMYKRGWQYPLKYTHLSVPPVLTLLCNLFIFCIMTFITNS